MSTQEHLAQTNVSESQEAPDGVTPRTEIQLTTFCKAVVDYLSTKDPESFQHCVNVCHKIIGPRLWTTNGEADSVLDSEGRRPAQFAKHSGTRSLITKFLLEHMAPFRNLGRNDLEVVALDGAFRYWPRECRLRLIDQIRKLRNLVVPVGDVYNVEFTERVLRGDPNPTDSNAPFSGGKTPEGKLPSDLIQRGEWPTYKEVEK